MCLQIFIYLSLTVTNNVVFQVSYRQPVVQTMEEVRRLRQLGHVQCWRT